ncbi:hypothetical protein Fmac_011197 [Flemingia macrophylla]|uniref:Ribosomal protein L32 n=1 Tax=Flemingia macrophylla TaxID=520843 RepID=A0ABD1MM15_9FABA
MPRSMSKTKNPLNKNRVILNKRAYKKSKPKSKIIPDIKLFNHFSSLACNKNQQLS